MTAMYAILRQGGHQYRVTTGDIIQIEKSAAEAGETIDLEDVLMLSAGESLEIGSPRVTGAKVTAQVLREGRGKKIVVYKFKRRKGSKTRQGHRHDFTEVKITGIYRNGHEVAAG